MIRPCGLLQQAKSTFQIHALWLEHQYDNKWPPALLALVVFGCPGGSMREPRERRSTHVTGVSESRQTGL